ncbi:unnamed protein product [Prorocentrum cordatum]|uniref:ZZ-type domain-containing protein n=1 Tax=Prorocentrum cordatum TaxID=2364126 RepID=A0ABN9T8U0_9DINO|nr:unnamed protein product [Polarella glacialis]
MSGASEGLEVEVHVNFVCDGCEAGPILGRRYRSLTRADYDLCESCFGKTGEHWSGFQCVRSAVRARVVPLPHSSPGSLGGGLVRSGFVRAGCVQSPLVGTTLHAVEELERQVGESLEVEVHVNFVCDGCEASPILGRRYRSLTRADYDLCESCFGKTGEGGLGFQRVKSSVLSRVVPSPCGPRGSLMGDGLVHYDVQCCGRGRAPLVGGSFGSHDRPGCDPHGRCPAEPPARREREAGRLAQGAAPQRRRPPPREGGGADFEVEGAGLPTPAAAEVPAAAESEPPQEPLGGTPRFGLADSAPPSPRAAACAPRAPDGPNGGSLAAAARQAAGAALAICGEPLEALAGCCQDAGPKEPLAGTPRRGLAGPAAAAAAPQRAARSAAAAAAARAAAAAGAGGGRERGSACAAAGVEGPCAAEGRRGPGALAAAALRVAGAEGPDGSETPRPRGGESRAPSQEPLAGTPRFGLAGLAPRALDDHQEEDASVASRIHGSAPRTIGLQAVLRARAGRAAMASWFCAQHASVCSWARRPGLMEHKWQAEDYHILRNNCYHTALRALADLLDVGGLPAWVTALASLALALSDRVDRLPADRPACRPVCCGARAPAAQDPFEVNEDPNPKHESHEDVPIPAVSVAAA